MDDAEDFVFAIQSRLHGTRLVTAPRKFRAEIEAVTWRLERDNRKHHLKRLTIKGDLPRQRGVRGKKTSLHHRGHRCGTVSGKGGERGRD